MTPQFREKLLEYAASNFDYGKRAKNFFEAFNVKKTSRNPAGKYKNSSLAVLGSSVARFQLSVQFRTEMSQPKLMRKKEELLQDRLLAAAAQELGMLSYVYAGNVTVENQEARVQLKIDGAALFKAVLAAIYLDLGSKRSQKLWEELFYPLLLKQDALDSQEADDTEGLLAPVSESEEFVFVDPMEQEDEISVCRVHPWDRHTRYELKTGKIALNPRIGQTAFFFRRLTKETLDYFNDRRGITPDCVSIFKLNLKDLPEAFADGKECAVAWKKIKGKAYYCLQASDKTAQKAFVRIKPHAVLSLGGEKSKEIMSFAKEIGLTVFETFLGYEISMSNF